MAKLTRYLQKIFANNSDQVGVFGTGIDKETSKNVETLQSSDYEDGWSSAIITNKNYPIWQERDGVDYGFSYQLKYLFQNGIPEWLSTETYYTNSFCRYGSDIYYSLQDNNTNHNPALNDGYWTLAAANINLSNLSNTGKIAIVHNSMPSNTYTDLTLGASGSTYTAPADGFLFFRKRATGAGQYVEIEVNNYVYSNGYESTTSLSACQVLIPMKKSDVATIRYDAVGVVEQFRFIYAVGTESEAN